MLKRKERIDRGIKVLSEDISALLSWREALYLSGPRVFPVLAMLILPLVLPPYWQKVLVSISVFALLAMSWDLLEQTGMVSLGQSLFFGVGAYLAGTMNHYLNWPPLITIPAATVLGGLICTVMPNPGSETQGRLFRHGNPDAAHDAACASSRQPRFAAERKGISGLDSFSSKWIRTVCGGHRRHRCSVRLQAG